MATPDLVVDARREGETGLLRLRGEARLELSERLLAEGRRLLEEGARHLLVSAQGLAFADSASVGALLELDRECRTRGGRLVLHGVRSHLAKTLDAMGLKERLAVAPSEAAARAVLPGPAPGRPARPPA